MAIKTKKKKKKLSPDEQKQKRRQAAQRNEIRSIFRESGFSRIASMTEKMFNFNGSASDFDDVFVHENIIAIIEYTIHQESEISTHLKKKKIVFDKILSDTEGFVKFIDETYPEFRACRNQLYADHHFRVKILYCSRNQVKISLKNEVPGVLYFDYNVVRYFKALTSSIHKSARFELFSYLGLCHSEIGLNVISAQNVSSISYKGSLLPEAYSSFDPGYKIVSFYIDAEALLFRVYVLRQDGWKDPSDFYQRMVSKAKIDTIRRYLREKHRVFVNNIIVTLPEDTKLLDENKNTLYPQHIKDTSPVNVQIPFKYNSVGLIDGQHRVLSYYEGGTGEADIAKLRKRQNLLVTGIIYPSGVNETDRIRFEAMLFLEINSNQTGAKSDLKQSIGLLLHPFEPESIAKQVVNALNNKPGPLANEFQRYFYEKDQMKTTSVVSFGLKALVRLNGSESLFNVWPHPNKEKLLPMKDTALLGEYIDFCATQINTFLAAVRAELPNDRWTTSKSVQNRMLTTTNINGMIICFRKIVSNNQIASVDTYRTKLAGIEKFHFKTYRSSQYTKMGQILYDEYFRYPKQP